jgi:potassium channel subfamily K
MDIESNRATKHHPSASRKGDTTFEPGRWWFASTAGPLLVCTVGPIASGFNICALVVPWRSLDSITSEEGRRHRSHVDDPGWLIAVTALALCVALVGSAALLLNITKRLSFAVGQTGAISGFAMGSLLLIAGVAVLSSSSFITDYPTTPGTHLNRTGAYYYAIVTAATYTILAMFLSLTVYGANAGYYPRDVRLSTASRTLMLQTIAFMTFLLVGALVFSKIEGWHYLDAFYWADVTILTIGLGDVVPKTMIGRLLLFPFAIGGILNVALVGIHLSENVCQAELMNVQP